MSKRNKVVFSKDIVEAKIATMLDYGRKEITTKKQLQKYAAGSPISYRNIHDIFKVGGFLVKIGDDYFIYVTPDFMQKYRVRFANVKKMWVGDVYQLHNDIVALTKTKQAKTNFPVEVNGVVVYYGKSTFDKRRFMGTIKYKRLIKWCEYFNQ